MGYIAELMWVLSLLLSSCHVTVAKVIMCMPLKNLRVFLQSKELVKTETVLPNYILIVKKSQD